MHLGGIILENPAFEEHLQHPFQKLVSSHNDVLAVPLSFLNPSIKEQLHLRVYRRAEKNLFEL